MFQEAPPPEEETQSGVVVRLHPEPKPATETLPKSEGLLTSLVGGIGALVLNIFVGHRDENHAARKSTRAIVARHVFVSGVRALPLVCVVAFGTGAAVVLQGMMAPSPPSGEFGRMLVVVMIRELAPLLTAVLMAGHSATAMAAEMQPIELALSAEKRPRIWPRMMGTSVASIALAVYFAAVAIFGAYVVSQIVTLRTFDAVREGLQQELAWFDAPLFLLKCGGLGAIVGWFGCRFALSAKSSPQEIARGASRAFVSSLMAGAVYSIGITFILYAFIGRPLPP